MEFFVRFTATRQVRSQMEANVSLSTSTIEDAITDEVRQAMGDATYHGTMVSVTIEVDLHDLIESAMDEGNYTDLTIVDADIDGDDDEMGDIDIEDVSQRGS